MEMSSDVINNLGSFASIVSIPITLILFIVDNTNRVKKARKECAKELCSRLIDRQKIDFFVVKRIIGSVLVGNFFVRERHISLADVLSESLNTISSSLFLDKEDKESYQNQIIDLWRRDEVWLRNKKRSLRRIFVYILILLLVFVSIDYFTEGFMLSLVKKINYSIVLKILFAAILVIIAIILSVFVLEIIYRDQFQGKIALEPISNELVDKVKSHYYLYNNDTHQVMMFNKTTDRRYYKKRVADSGSGVFSPWGYRVVYDFQHREVRLENYSKNFSILIHVFKTSGVNGGVIFDVARFELSYKGHQLAQIQSIIDFYKGKTMAHNPSDCYDSMYNWQTYHHKSIVYEFQGDNYSALQNTRGKHEVIIGVESFTPFEIIINGKSWKMFEI